MSRNTSTSQRVSTPLLDTPMALVRHGRSPYLPAAKEDIPRPSRATETRHRSPSKVDQISKSSQSEISLPLRPAQRQQKRPGDTTIDDHNHEMKRPRMTRDAAQGRPKNPELDCRIFSSSQKIDARVYISRGEIRQQPDYLDHDQRRPHKHVRFADDSQPERRLETRRPRLADFVGERSRAIPDPQTGAKHKEKVEDIRERIDFPGFGYNEELKTPEEMLMKYRADVQISQLHQKRYKLIAERYAVEEAELWFQSRIIAAQLMVDVEEFRQRANIGAAAADAKANLR